MKVLRKLVAVLMVVIIGTSFPVPVSALTDEQLEFFARSSIYFYNPGAGRKSCFVSNMSGDTIMAKVVSYLSGNNPMNYVLSENGIAGILANFEGESGFNPFRFEGDSASGPGYGIAQFTGYGGISDSPILEPLRSDPRTANYFNDYFDVKYTKYDSSTGYPTEQVPAEVIDAWLEVQLDYFFGPGSQFENVKVGTYRNMGGTMGLDYISDDMTAREAMDAAKTPEDAARIFVWIMERPRYKETAASGRGARAEHWLEFTQSISGNSFGPTNAGSADGSGVTIIGDSITVGSESAIKSMMPNADIYAQTSKQFYTGTADNPGGITILKQLADTGKLGDTVVYALGTNSTITSREAQEVVDTVGSSRKIVFVTNYSTQNDYTTNNNVFAKMKNDNSNVLIADWKSAVQSQSSMYLAGDGIHPNAEGQALFASVLSSTVGVSSNMVSTCSGYLASNGGLTDAQAQALADYYNSSAVDASYYGLPFGKTNCVSFSAFFVQAFTSIGRDPSRGWGNGKDVAHNLSRANGLSEGEEPSPFAVFSVTAGSTMCSDGYICGHTGIVVAVDGDVVTTVEAAYPSTPAYVKKRDISYFTNDKYGVSFTYLSGIMNMSELLDVVGN